MVSKIIRIERTGENGVLKIVLQNGKTQNRVCEEYTRGKYAGKTVFKAFDNVYSFATRKEEWKELGAEYIQYEGKINKVKKEKTKDVLSRRKKSCKHERYNDIKTCIECDIPVYLVGEAGTGKNYTLEQIAKEQGLDFFYTNSVQQEYKLTGFVDAGGTYHETEFYKACVNENECIFFLDEMDASIPEVLVLLNAAIANKYFEFPTGKVRCDHVHFVAAGNTFGNGADDVYTGRLTLDQATLDRFAIIDFGYSIDVEMHITGNNAPLVSFIRQLREKSATCGVRATYSYRCMQMITRLEQTALPLSQIIRISVLKGLDQDTINTLRIEGASKYHKALQQLQR